MKNVNSIYIYAQSEGWELLTHADDNTSVWTRSLSGFMLHKFCISSISSIIGPRFFLFFCWNPPWPTHTHTFLHINCLTIIIESPQTFPNLGPKMSFSSNFPDLEKGTSVSPNFPKNVQITQSLRTTGEKYYIPRMALGKLVRWTQGSCWSDAGCQGPPSTCATEINTRV